MREKRKSLPDKPTQTEMAQRIDETGASQTGLSKIERAAEAFTQVLRHPRPRLVTLEKYGFNREEIRELNERFNLELEFVTDTSLLRANEGPGAPQVRLLGTTNAGTDTAMLAGEDLTMVYVPEWISERYDLKRVFAMDVVGDSMACENVMRAIPEGSRVFFLENGPLHDGTVVSCRLWDEGIHVIKEFRKHDGYAVLLSYNKRHKPIILDEHNPGDVVGVYLTHIPRGPLLR